ncbi:hypothetical protein IE077_004139 [Cardiosporidium cionae]|uniref:RNA helicase n=1 Tax=Cardiosporidium cionae TaxID=476202 RepID=A0ABQ7JE16_9APIC|nr:hypothetical protein IE077_004139 [Cardiosporidium cionae]|eukprot:KAF8822263.1 hypothetical protein IE077_004139 [Cardiosporidium cionae]
MVSNGITFSSFLPKILIESSKFPDAAFQKNVVDFKQCENFIPLLDIEVSQLNTLWDLLQKEKGLRIILETHFHIPAAFLKPESMFSHFLNYVNLHASSLASIRWVLRRIYPIGSVFDELEPAFTRTELDYIAGIECSDESPPKKIKNTIEELLGCLKKRSRSNPFYNIDTHSLWESLKKTIGSIQLYKCIFLMHLIHKFLLDEFSKELIAFNNLRHLTDLRSPQQQFPAARHLNRSIFVHEGPTNSGKTHRALAELRKASTGLYCGPLRLLAYEIYERLKAEGKRCALLTGQEQLYDADFTHIACTAEMAPLNLLFDVAIIDEMQLIADSQRGAAWTRALLGLQAKHVHLCGDTRFVSLIRKICTECNEKVFLHHYERLLPLRLEELPLSSLDDIQSGDCVLCFTRKEILRVKFLLEKEGCLVYIIYGTLPPELRKEQAASFNTPYHTRTVMVASDAIGLGLNLNIRRIIFWSLQKYDGHRTRFLFPVEIRQIAGRAGRFGWNYREGRVTCRREEDHPRLTEAFSEERNFSPIESAGLFPTFHQLSSFAEHLSLATHTDIPFDEMLQL